MRDRAIRLAVIGLGKLGLPLAVFYASRGARVVGCDRDEHRAAAIDRRAMDVSHELGLAEALAASLDFRTTTDTTQSVAESNHVLVVVPVTASPDGVDFAAIDDAVDAIVAGLRPGSLVIFETTLPVGTTRRRFLPRLQRSGLTLGRDLFVAYSPERVFIGRVFRDLDTYPKIVGGVDGPSTERAVSFYERYLRAPVWRARDADTAEFVKLAETSYRTTNIALANELAMIADVHGIDVSEAIRCANSQPYSAILAPGVGVGGHCLPVYPFLISQGGTAATLVMLAREINAEMPEYAVRRLEQALGSLAGGRVLILGVAYRPGTPEAAFSPAFGLRDALVARGARVSAYDPLLGPADIASLGFEPASLSPAPDVDAVVLQTAHPELITLDFSRFPSCRVILDGRNVLDRARIEACGKLYLGIGR